MGILAGKYSQGPINMVLSRLSASADEENRVVVGNMRHFTTYSSSPTSKYLVLKEKSKELNGRNSLLDASRLL